MSAAKKLEFEIEPLPENETSTDKTIVPQWKQKKQDRQKLLRAIRAKSYTETIRSVIRKELKKNDGSSSSDDSEL